MSSLVAGERARKIDEAAFYLATGGALAAAVFSVGAAAGAPEFGTLGAEIALLGAVVSWLLRGRGRARLLYSTLLTLVVAAFWAQRALGQVGLVDSDAGMHLAFRMTIPLVAASFFLVQPEIAAFALVPAVSVLGLSAGQGDEFIARVGFVVFLPLALISVGYGMMATGETADGTHRLPEATPRRRVEINWRARHWVTLAGAIAAIMIAAHLIYLPVSSWASAHRWQIIGSIASPAGGFRRQMEEPLGQSSTYRVGSGPAQLSDTPVLSFTGDYAGYWRGRVYDQYMGATWSRSEVSAPRAEAEPFPSGGTLQLVPTSASRKPFPAYLVRAEFPLPFIFYAPGQVVSLTAQGPLGLPPSAGVVVDGYGQVSVPSGTLRAGTSYLVTVESLDPANPRIVPARPETPSPSYLKVPFESQRVAELAKRLTAKEASPARRMTTLIGYLQSNCLYDLNAPAIPAGYDAVDYFVFRQRVGYCDLFASALAVMGRSVGVPTRFVTGYAFPSPAGPQDRDKPGGEQRYVLRMSDAHAWVEAYLPELGGWVTLDATPTGRTAETPAAPWWKRAALGWSILWRSDPLKLIAWGLLVLACFLVLLTWLRGRLRRRPRPPRVISEQDWRSLVAATYLRLCHLLRRRGIARHPAQTPYEYLALVEQTWAEAGPAAAAVLPVVRALTHTFVLARYSGGPVTEVEAQAVRASLQEARRLLRRVRRPRRQTAPVSLRRL